MSNYLRETYTYGVTFLMLLDEWYHTIVWRIYIVFFIDSVGITYKEMSALMYEEPFF